MNKLAQSSNPRLFALLVCVLSIATVFGFFSARTRAEGTTAQQNQPVAMLAAGRCGLDLQSNDRKTRRRCL
jgi:hypothetical protein